MCIATGIFARSYALLNLEIWPKWKILLFFLIAQLLWNRSTELGETLWLWRTVCVDQFITKFLSYLIFVHLINLIDLCDPLPFDVTVPSDELCMNYIWLMLPKIILLATVKYGKHFNRKVPALYLMYLAKGC